MLLSSLTRAFRLWRERRRRAPERRFRRLAETVAAGVCPSCGGKLIAADGDATCPACVRRAERALGRCLSCGARLSADGLCPTCDA